ncbi:MAG TPA: hypothetical protein VFS21_29560 [Roseiflexaceae bacterium]|nr:hypothetical protein [Roseiflexaceae bacterium]
MATSEPGAPSSERAPRLPLWLRTLLAHALTATIAVLLSLTLGSALRPATPTSGPTAPPMPTPRPTAVPTPAPTSAPLDANIARQELADLSAEIDQLWTVSYLSRALIYLSEAESALRSNDWQTVSQSLIAVDDSLLLSYGRADQSIKSPIEQIRVEIDRTRNDLYLRPEGMDTRLSGLRQTILALVEARS